MDFSKDLSVIILAAGKGKRMKSNTPKVLHKVCSKPIIYYLLNAVHGLQPKNVFLVVGFKGELVERYAKENFPYISVVYQEKQLGTAHAVSVLESQIKNLAGNCLVIAGDMPLITAESLYEVVKTKIENQCAAVLATTRMDNPYGYGRIIKDKKGNISLIVEEADANRKEKKIKEVNTSVYCFDTALLFKYLKEISPENSQKEFYLTDIISKFVSSSNKVRALTFIDSAQFEGINDKAALAKVEKIMQGQIMIQENIKI